MRTNGVKRQIKDRLGGQIMLKSTKYIKNKHNEKLKRNHVRNNTYLKLDLKWDIEN